MPSLYPRDTSGPSRGYTPEPDVLLFYKIDAATGTGLPGAVFHLLSGNRVAARAVSGSDGAVRLAVPRPGAYRLVEAAPPLGYQPRTEVFRVHAECGAHARIGGIAAWRFRISGVALTQVTGSFTARAVNARSGSPLPGAVFELRQGAATLDTVVSSSLGAVPFTGLSPGVYSLVETRIPAGFIARAGGVHRLVVDAAGNAALDGGPADDAELAHDPDAYSFAFTVCAENDEGGPLGGASFTLKKAGRVFARAATASDGLLRFVALPPGNYELEEVSPPPGYMPDTRTHHIKAGRDGALQIDAEISDLLCVTHEALCYSVFFQNEDRVSGEPVPGAVFTLLRDGRKLARSRSDACGSVHFGTHAPGTYEIRETSAPKGYRRNAEAVAVIIRSTGAVTLDGVAAGRFIFYSEPCPMP